MTVAQYIAYFKNIAETLLAIGSTPQNNKFAAMSIDEILGGLRTDIDTSTPVFILEDFEGFLSRVTGGNGLETITGAFIICQKVENDNYEQQAAVLDACKLIGINVLSKMLKDYEAGVFTDFEPNSVKYQTVKGILDNASGLRFEFELTDLNNLCFNPIYWA